MALNYEVLKNKSETLIFRKNVPSGASGYIDLPLLSHGVIDKVRIRFAVGENGTLRIRPVVILPKEIMLDLFRYASGGDQSVSGDSEEIETEVRHEIENKAIARVYYWNDATDPLADDSIVNVDIGVTYFSVIEQENIIGPRRKKWGFA